MALFENEHAPDEDQSGLMEVRFDEHRSLTLHRRPLNGRSKTNDTSKWDEGLALASYLSSESSEVDWNRSIVVDLGADSGIAGLTSSVLSKGRSAVFLTVKGGDTRGIKANISSNAKHWSYGKGVNTPRVNGLIWGSLIDQSWIDDMIHKAKADKRKHLLLLCSNVAHRVSIFVPVLSTISQIFSKLKQSHRKVQVRCLMACHSTRPHSASFFKIARDKLGFAVNLLAIVTLPLDDQKLDLRNAQIEYPSQPNTPPDYAPRNCRTVWIVELRKLPYTFSI